jgi:hypothetical protein
MPSINLNPIEFQDFTCQFIASIESLEFREERDFSGHNMEPHYEITA